jgi:opacity protein-like surface antigen
MKKRLLALVMGAVVLALPALASADTVKVGNLEKKPLKYSIRCGSGDWTLDTLNPLQNKNWTCKNSEVSLQIGTTNSDGSVTEKTIALKDGITYALVKPGNTNDYTAYDTNLMVVVVNASTRKLTFTRSCSRVASKALTVAAKDYSWVYAGSPPECSPYTASIETDANDGSQTTVSRPMTLGNIYTINWNDAHQAWDIQEARQGGGATNGN